MGSQRVGHDGAQCKLICIEWMNRKAFVYSTGNYIQYPVINHNGKGYKKECITESLCCIAEINFNKKNTLDAEPFHFYNSPERAEL